MASGNDNLVRAKMARNDDFWTRMPDIEAELCHYPGAFDGKSVYLPCDEAGKSRFWDYFRDRFGELGLASLTATSWHAGGRGRISSLRAGREGAVEETHGLLDGDGDFLSEECLAILAGSDVVVTNLPFSRFRPYVRAMMSAGCDFVVIGGKNGGKYQDTVGYVIDGRMRLGRNAGRGTMRFETPSGEVESVASYWFTTLVPDVPCRSLSCTATYEGNEGAYPRYANLDAIEVPRIADIPCDYDGVMGVPVTFLEYYDPNEWELLGTNATVLADAPQDPHIKENSHLYRRHNLYLKRGDGTYRRVYDRMMIRRRHPPAGDGNGA